MFNERDTSERVKKEWSVIGRPLRFEDVKGNSFKKDTLVTSLAKEVFPQMVLFSGQAGVSKTTLAFISALSLQCKQPIKGEPCLECTNCQNIVNELILDDTTQAEKTSCGVTLWNMAIKSSVQDADEIIEILSYEQDSEYPHRVFILEEPQNMSTQCQDRLLLAFENLPFNTYILMCTTDVHKLRPAFSSRALHLSLTTPSLDEIVELLIRIAASRNVPIPKNKIALKTIAQYCGSVPRDSIKLFQLLAETGDITLSRVLDWIGQVSASYYIRYYEVVQNDITEILDFVMDLELDNISYISFIRGLREFTKDLLLMKYNKSVWKYSTETKKDMRGILDKFTYKEFLLFNNYMSSIVAGTESQAQSELLALSFKVSDHLLSIVTDHEKLISRENAKSVQSYVENKQETLLKSATINPNTRISSAEDILKVLNQDNNVPSIPNIIKLQEN